MVKSPLLDRFLAASFLFPKSWGNPTSSHDNSPWLSVFETYGASTGDSQTPQRLQVSRGKVAILGGDWCRSCGCASGSRANCHWHRAPCFWDQLKKGLFGLWKHHGFERFRTGIDVFFSTIYHMFSEMRVFNCDFSAKAKSGSLGVTKMRVVMGRCSTRFSTHQNMSLTNRKPDPSSNTTWTGPKQVSV